MRSGQVVEAAQQLAVLAVRAAVVDAHGAHAHLLAPDVAARSAPPHHGACVGVEILGAQVAVRLGVEPPGDARPLRSEVVAALGEIMPPSPMARRALAALLASPPQVLAPFVPARRALQPDHLGRTAGDLRRLQVTVLGGMPKMQDARVLALGAIEALQCQPPATVRTSGIVEHPRPRGHASARRRGCGRRRTAPRGSSPPLVT